MRMSHRPISVWFWKTLKIKKPINQICVIVLGVIGVLFLVAAYQKLSHRQHELNPSDTTIPTFRQLAEGFVEICQPRGEDLRSIFGIEEGDHETGFFTSWLWKDFTTTYKRLFIGMATGSVIAVLTGLLMGSFPWLAALLLPSVSFFAKIPGTAMLAVFFVLAGVGETMFVSMIAFGIMPSLIQVVYLSVKHDISEDEINKAYTLGASTAEIIFEIIFRQTLPKIIDNIRLQIGPAMVCLIAAEMLVGQVGIGYQIRMQQHKLHMNVVYDYLVILAVSGLVMDKLMSILLGWLCPWFVRIK